MAARYPMIRSVLYRKKKKNYNSSRLQKIKRTAETHSGNFQLEKELAIKKKEIPATPPKLQNLRKEKSKLEKDQQAVEVKVKKVKGLLSKAPKPSAESLSKDVSLPDPKPAIAGSAPFRFLCRNGKIFPLSMTKPYREWFYPIWRKQA